MRTVGSRWRNLAQGYERALELERSLHDSWGPQVEQVQRQQEQAGLGAWNSHRGQKVNKPRRPLSIWQQAGLGRRLRLQFPIGSSGRWVGINVYVNQILLVTALLLVFIDNSISKQISSLIIVFVFIKVLIAFARTAWRVIRSGNFQSGESWQVATEAPKPQHPKPPREEPISLDLVEQWWQHIGDDNSSKAMTAGDEGEEAFFRHLTWSLPNNHVGLRGILVRERLDVDLLVVGPTNIWVFEVKHWTGTISCHNGTWRRSKSYYAPGGALTHEEEEIRPFDHQWLREQREVEKTLRLHVRPSHLASLTAGGLVFTHPDVVLNIDESRKCRYGQPSFWERHLRVAAEREDAITQQSQLKILDALLNRAERIDSSYSQRRCCIELAEQLADDMAELAESYVTRHA